MLGGRAPHTPHGAMVTFRWPLAPRGALRFRPRLPSLRSYRAPLPSGPAAFRPRCLPAPPSSPPRPPSRCPLPLCPSLWWVRGAHFWVGFFWSSLACLLIGSLLPFRCLVRVGFWREFGCSFAFGASGGTVCRPYGARGGMASLWAFSGCFASAGWVWGD